jgi:acyl-CoA synthetase (AMP-forming)/AMP-acid ligase II
MFLFGMTSVYGGMEGHMEDLCGTERSAAGVLASAGQRTASGDSDQSRRPAVHVREEPMTIVDVLLQHAIERPDASAYVFLRDDGTEETLTFGQLTRRAQAIAAQLQTLACVGERAILLYQPGLDFVEGILACFFARLVAVPVSPLRNARELPRLAGILQDSGARLVLSNTVTRNVAARTLGSGPLPGGPAWLSTDTVPTARADDFEGQLPDESSLAFLQYTSGSTGNPKGVMVTHANLLHNEMVIRDATGHDDGTVFAGWLPFYHDMGLIGNVFQPLFLGVASVLMAPMTFLVTPATWLRAISKFRATTSGGPNFAYELCVHRVSPEEIEGIDLSSWRVAFNGAEPVKAHVIEAFSRKFAPYGFRADAFYPCYGLAESTLFVTGGAAAAPVVRLPVDPEELHRNKAVEQSDSSTVLVGCGRTNLGQSVVIVDPESMRVLPEGHVGEIWQSGRSVAAGYWGKAELTDATFGARTADGDGPFMRTGDLGFLMRGELFVSGRLKDLIIIRGRNYYPDDIESAVYHGRPALRPGGAAAFTLHEDGGETRLIVVAEVQRTFLSRLDTRTYRSLLAEVRAQIADSFGLRLAGLVLIRPGAIPKTTSGKLRRRHCRELHLNGQLDRAEIRQPEALQPSDAPVVAFDGMEAA